MPEFRLKSSKISQISLETYGVWYHLDRIWKLEPNMSSELRWHLGNVRFRVSNTCVQMPDSGLFRAFRLVFWVVSHPTRPLRNPRTEQNCLRPRKRHSVLQTVFYLALENFLFRSVMKLLGFSRIDAPDEVFVETP